MRHIRAENCQILCQCNKATRASLSAYDALPWPRRRTSRCHQMLQAAPGPASSFYTMRWDFEAMFEARQNGSLNGAISCSPRTCMRMVVGHPVCCPYTAARQRVAALRSRSSNQLDKTWWRVRIARVKWE